MKIIIRKELLKPYNEGYDFHAHIDGRPETQKKGGTAALAIGSLIQSYPEQFGITIEETG